MCSDFGSPTFVHDFPPSTDLYTPSPHETERWPLFSPLPTQTVSESFGSMVTQPMENEAWSSKTGVNVVPALVVFQTPPAATATYHVRVSRGSTATSTTRPETMAGPMPRSSRPEKSVSSYLGGAANVAAATQCV